MGFRPLTQESLTGAGGRALLTAATSTHTRGLLALAAAAAGAVLFAVYERLSATAPLTADSANAVLQGQSMAAGNLLLHGWTLSGASFYATDAPFYALFAAVRGLSPAVAHDVGALIYTLLVIAACFLARGSARGGEGLGRMLVTLVLLIAPAPGAATELLLLGPFHGGTTLVLLLALLALDAGETHPAWTAALGVLLALAVLSDALALYVGVVPVVVVLAARLAARGRAAGSDLAALAAALLALPAALVLGQLVHQLGGFETVPLQGSFAEVDDLPKNLALTVQGALLLFGANFFGQPIATPSTIVILVHLAGFGLVAMSCRDPVHGVRGRAGRACRRGLALAGPPGCGGRRRGGRLRGLPGRRPGRAGQRRPGGAGGGLPGQASPGLRAGRLLAGQHRHRADGWQGPRPGADPGR